MKHHQSGKLNRRSFFKTLGSAGLGAIAGATISGKATLVEAAKSMHVGQRPFGTSGQTVPILSLGTMFDTGANQLLLRQAVKWGVTYWDTATYYNRWGSEPGIGKYFSRFPQDREKVFLVSKSPSHDPGQLEGNLDQSLALLQTDYLDLYFLHVVDDAAKSLTPAVRKWADQMKSKGKIRMFGFSTHGNMAATLMAASKLGWIDGIMTTYNYRLLYDDEMQRAIDACHRAGIGLTAMKTQAKSVWRSKGKNSEAAKALHTRLLDQGFTKYQAKLKAIWADERIAAVCSQMDTMTILKANTEAAVSEQKLATTDMDLLQTHARKTAHAYCAGCIQKCQTAVDGYLPVGDVMRALMYARSYGDLDRARDCIEKISGEQRRRLAKTDFANAEAVCPQRLPVARLIHEALTELA